MNRISFPLTSEKGSQLADVQDALRLLLEHGVCPLENGETVQELSANLNRERAEKTSGPATRRLVKIFQAYAHLPASGQIDAQTIEALNSWLAQDTALTELRGALTRGYVVCGFVRFADGSPASKVKVRAYDRDLRTEQPLGESTTDRAGAYRIDYSANQLVRQERGSADLVVRAFNDQGEEWAASPTLFNAPAQANVDVTIPAERHLPPTSFERIDTAIQPLLGQLKIEDLEENEKNQDLSFLAGETGFDKSLLARFVLAHHLARAGINPEFWFALLGACFEHTEDKGLKENLRTAWTSLQSLDSRAARKALLQSFHAGEIHEVSESKAEEWIEESVKLIASASLGQTDAPSFVAMALDHAGIRDAAKQEQFARLYNEYKAFTPQLLEGLKKNKSFKKSEIADLRTSFRLADLTRGSFSVVKMLKEEFDVRGPDQIRKLARQDEREWVELIERKYKAGEITLPIRTEEPVTDLQPNEAKLYAKSLERAFRESFPTEAFAGGLDRALNNGGTLGIRFGEKLLRLIDRQPEFDLLTTSIDKFLTNGGIRPEFRPLAKDEDFTRELKAVQRVFKLAQRFEATDFLLAEGVHSAQMAYRMGQSEFVRRFAGKPGFTEEMARRAWNRAAETHAAVMTVIGDLKSLDPDSLPAVLKNDATAFSKFPNWENLFQSGDICHCEQCRSVFSPAAYFADLLVFLRDRRAKNPAQTVKEILFARRPDLGYLELNCENALTTLPYVDVVCEVLERVIAAGENEVQLVGFGAIPTGNAAAKAAVAAALAAQNLSPGADFSLSQVDPANPNLWVVHGDEKTYLLKKTGPPDFFAELIPNTKASSEELRAYPAYVNPKAYGKLRQAQFPFGLPFDLFAEEVRAAFRKCNLQRWDLMRTIRGPVAPNNPTDGELAAEYFGISCDAGAPFDEKRLILQADPTNAGQAAAWGETGNAGWLATVSNVKTFLAKSGLEYEQLLTLLDLSFINPSSDILIQHLDSSCDTDKKVVQGLDAPKLDRIHRFLRLWRKLTGWKMWELDLVIRSSGIGNGALDEPFLINLYFLSRLKTRLGPKTAVPQLCGLFGNLSAETHFTRLHEKRSEGFYQSLFLNKKLIQPIDPAFEVVAVDVGGPTVEKISGHRPVLLAALGVKENDLDLLAALTRVSNGLAYITDDLTLANLSFIWRHAWLAKSLKFKVEEWITVLKLLQQDVASFTSSRAAYEFVEDADQLKATGFSVDELNWILAADRSAKAAVKETDAARFLGGLRTELQRIRTEYDPAHYDFLDPPADPDRLTSLLTSLLQQLKREEPAAQFFINTLKDEIVQEKTVSGLPAAFTLPAAITGPPNHIRISYAPVLEFGGTMTAAQRTTLLTDPTLAVVTGLPSYQQAIQELFKGKSPVAVPDLPAGFSFPPAIIGAPNRIPIRYAPVLRFSGLMTAAERNTLLNDPLLAAVSGIPGYQQAVDEFFQKPRLAMKFLDPLFTAALPNLPAGLDLKTLSDPTLMLRISYDPEERVLRFAGILSKEEKDLLDGLSADVAYRNAVNNLFTQPTLPAPVDRLWLDDTVLKFPLRDPSNPGQDHLNENIATAIRKALVYLGKTLSESLVVRQSGGQLGLAESLTRRLVTDYAVIGPDNLLVHLTGTFAATQGVVDYPTLKPTFDGWFWASRVALLLKKWKLTQPQLERLKSLTAGGAQLLDFGSLPIGPVSATAPIDRFIRTSRLMRFKDTVPETGIEFLEMLQKLSSGGYANAAAFADDVQLLNDGWKDADVETLIASLDLNYPNDYLLAENWERLRRAFYFIENLNAGAKTVVTFAAASMTDLHAKALKELLRSKFGGESWLSLSAEIQDALRERKRDALASYLLAQPKPADAPTGKWENTNDLYAYYLLDVEMGACMLTSRLVQASGSVQLFVQRCFMGIEPDVVVKADGTDGDTAWRWWKWMRKFQPWVLARKLFTWPEIMLEPELKKDRSVFFKELENELQQNDINQFTVETAFANYLQKLDGVAQLEIAGFYQEDDADDTIIHVFGRTPGAEPHTYYYRRFDYRQWTPWEKVDLDIQGDYLIPAVVNRRLFLFWPVFTEVPDESGNSTVATPQAGQPSVPIKKTWKKLKLQLAVSDYGQGKWTPKKISKDFFESASYDVDIVRKFYRFFPIDRTDIDGRFAIKFDGWSLGSDGYERAGFGAHAFEIAGCKGVPEAALMPGNFKHVVQPEWASVGEYDYPKKSYTTFSKWSELGSPDEFGHVIGRHDPGENDFTLENQFASTTDALRYTPVLRETPWFFKMSPPWHLSYLDKLMADGLLGAFGQSSIEGAAEFPAPLGSWLSFFYNDKRRTFFVLPTVGRPKGNERVEAEGTLPGYYPDVKRYFRGVDDYFEGQIRTWLENFNLSALTNAQRQQLEAFLQARFPGEILPPFTDEQVRALLVRLFMRWVHFYLGATSSSLFRSRRFDFRNFYHPFVCDFTKMVNNPARGIPGIMRRETQLKDSGFSFPNVYKPTPWVVGYPKEVVDFSPDGAYSPYNWELFFHAPLLIANMLSKNQRFEEAREWYHYIFNPIGVESAVPGGSVMSKYWITKPFFETTDPQYVQQRIENIMRLLAGDTSVPGYSLQLKKQLEDQVLDWRKNPFDPHRIANYRTVAYQKTVVVKYLENLIAWGDYLFRQDSMESTNEATQLYILAAELLGPPPKRIPPQVNPPVESYNELEKQFDAFSNALVEVENLIPQQPGVEVFEDVPPIPLLYFCIPPNEKMQTLRDTITDRLYKLRHCMNIEGVVRQLSLFEPPIDPAALLKALAAGLDISSALTDLNAPLPVYRFNILLQKANEVCGDVKALGAALLGALEKKDGEALALLRQTQEIRVLESAKSVREKQLEEAKENLEGLKKSKELAEIKKSFYETRDFMNAGEKVALALNTASTLIDDGIAVGYSLAGGLKLIPQFILGGSGFGGSPHAVAETGGKSFGDSADDLVKNLESIARGLDKTASLASTVASYQRRQDEWDFQTDLAEKELEQLDRQIAAAELRTAIAEKELDNHVQQMENARAVDLFMRSKYTNDELYQWQVGQISGVYFESYRLAYDLAKRAERCARFELGSQDGTVISFGYWDSLKKGLLSGEQLQYDLRRLETAYLEQNRREFELTKHISLALLDPFALVELREKGRCFFRLPEELFDLDYPGHYFRRMKSVSLTLPCVAGPNTTVSCTLRLLRNSVRVNTLPGENGYVRNASDDGVPADDDRFIENNIPARAIATSGGQNDSGVFELNFRDERYLPFEGAGAISEWSLELFSDLKANNPNPGDPDYGKPLRQFDYSTITDAVLQLKYTAREDAGEFKNSAITHLRQYFAESETTPSFFMLNLRRDFPSAWSRFVNPAVPSNGNIYELEMSADLFPIRDAGKPLELNTAYLLARCTKPGNYAVSLTPPQPAPAVTMSLKKGEQYGNLHSDEAALGVEIDPTAPPQTWKIKITSPGGGNLNAGEVKELFLVLRYGWG